MTSATHNGSCQLCGAVQAAANKNSRLAKHGYTTRFGFFEGTCPGSGELPYELSAGLIADAIAGALKQATELEAEAKALRTSDAGTATWVNIYLPATGYGRGAAKSRRVWRKVEIVRTKSFNRDVWGYVTTSDKGEPVTFELPGYYSAQPINEIIFKQNVEYSRNREERAKQLRLYAQWQQPRVDQWTLKPLYPRTAEAGAVVEAKKLTTRTKGARVSVWFGSGTPKQEGVILGSYRGVGGAEVSVELDGGKVVTVSQRRLSLVQKAVA